MLGYATLTLFFVRVAAEIVAEAGGDLRFLQNFCVTSRFFLLQNELNAAAMQSYSQKCLWTP
ncbi:MAG: hypothetical protein LBJ57_01030 [Prevotellaceae bacterium]|jgi:hypothetical protein|nr:hypothetical protein [Prevotellaceae bacterium]